MARRLFVALQPFLVLSIAVACALSVGACGGGEPARASSAPVPTVQPMPPRPTPIVETDSSIPAGHADPGPPPTLMVAVLRKDGILLPYASFSDGTWVSPRPYWGHEDDAPGADDADKAWFEMIARTVTTWHTPGADDSPEALQVSGAAKIEVDCSNNWGLRTEAKPLGEEDEAAWPAGIALNGGTAAGGMRDVAGEAGEATTVLDLIRGPFAASEADERKRQPRSQDESAAPSTGDSRRQSSIKLNALYRSRDAVGGRIIYFVDAEREYAGGPPGDSDCGPVTKFQAWMTRQGDDWR